LGGAGGALGGGGGALGGAPGLGAAAETPGGGGASGSFSPQLIQFSASRGFIVPHLGHFFSAFLAVGGRKHIGIFPFLKSAGFG
jgi:hypothetical protein